MNKNKGHIIKNVKPGSIAEEMGLEPGDKIMAVDGTVIEDVFDFEFLIQDTYIEVDVGAEGRRGVPSGNRKGF